jgi:hypothetical protein
MTGVGSVRMRGISVKTDGTLFDGDQIEIGAGSTARVQLASGQKLLLDQFTEVRFHQGTITL